MCEKQKPLHAYIKSNFTRPNLLVKGPHGNYDLTATFAKIESQYGSRTECDEKEKQRRRAQKEQLKLECVRYAISGWREGEERAEHWLLPEVTEGDESYYTAFTDPEVLANFEKK